MADAIHNTMETYVKLMYMLLMLTGTRSLSHARSEVQCRHQGFVMSLSTLRVALNMHAWQAHRIPHLNERQAFNLGTRDEPALPEGIK